MKRLAGSVALAVATTMMMNMGSASARRNRPRYGATDSQWMAYP